MQTDDSGLPMRAAVITLTSVLVTILLQPAAFADPEEDRLAFVAFFKARFPDVPLADYADGIYALDSDARDQWIDIEIFPPYEFAVEQGEELWQADFADGETYSDCFSAPTEAIRPNYPKFDDATSEVVTLESAINRCRTKHDEIALNYKDAEIVSITAYLAFEARGQKLNIVVPTDNKDALAAYESGKQFYYSKRGQLNFACSDCHGISAGQYVRADHLSAGLGHPTHFPVYRSKLGKVISLHQRFSGCVRDVRANPFALQSEEFRNLEYFLTYMSNGFEVNGPGSRK
jgi:sulfur-oxidizing protein SoxA